MATHLLPFQAIPLRLGLEHRIWHKALWSWRWGRDRRRLNPKGRRGRGEGTASRQAASSAFICAPKQPRKETNAQLTNTYVSVATFVWASQSALLIRASITGLILPVGQTSARGVQPVLSPPKPSTARVLLCPSITLICVHSFHQPQLRRIFLRLVDGLAWVIT